LKLKICLAQLESITGSILRNIEKVKEVVKSHEADLYVFPEMFLTGYMIKDMVYKLAIPPTSKYIKDLQELAKSNNIGIVVGFPELSNMGYIYNATLAVNNDGNIFIYRKRHLPTFTVFDEHRWFRQYKGSIRPWKFKGVNIGLAICYDTFFPEIFKAYTLRGVKLHIIISAAPDTSVPLFHRVVMGRAIETTTYFIWVNTVGIVDGLTFGGNSIAIDPLGNVIEKLKEYEEDVKIVSIDLSAVYRFRIARPVVKDSMREDAEELLKAYNELEA